jgi:two-component system sensor histidine kinase CreC
LLRLSGKGTIGHWESDLITLAIGNLLDNAIDFSPMGGTVLVLVEDSSVTVQDQGPGVPEFALPRLGEKFFTTARPNGKRCGSGLGLAIALRVMTLHEGRMLAQNTNPGLRVTLYWGTLQPLRYT